MIRRSPACRQAEQSAKLPFDRADVAGLAHQIDPELFESLLSLGNISDVGLAGFLPLPHSIENSLGDPDGYLARPEAGLLKDELPVALLDRPDLGHHLGLEPLSIEVGSRRGERQSASAIFAGDRLEDANDLRVFQADSKSLLERQRPFFA